MPDLHIALCKRCHLRTWQRSLGSVAVAALVLVCGAAAARIAFLAWPWIPWPLFTLASCGGAVMAWALGAMVTGRSVSGSSGWRGVPARVVNVTSEGWTLLIASAALAASLTPMTASPPRERAVSESDGAGPGLAAFATVVVTATFLWFAWHPSVRVVNVTDTTMEVLVDGRTVALIPGVPGEAPSAGVDVRVPEGPRAFRARSLDGATVDESEGWVGLGRDHLYAPGSQGRCFRVEQRAYGRARQPGPEVMHLPADRRFHTFVASIDAWFQPNPPTEPNVWFSGGVRRSVRLGECPTEHAPDPRER